jgi:hypothetical protein
VDTMSTWCVQGDDSAPGCVRHPARAEDSAAAALSVGRRPLPTDLPVVARVAGPGAFETVAVMERCAGVDVKVPLFPFGSRGRSQGHGFGAGVAAPGHHLDFRTEQVIAGQRDLPGEVPAAADHQQEAERR